MTALAPTLQAFFTDRLISQRNASPHTIAAYRDTFRLLLRFAHSRPARHPSKLDIDDLDAPLIAAFLDHLETDRGNSARDPQRAARGDPLAVTATPLCATPSTPTTIATRARDPTQTHRPRARHLPRPSTRSTRCSPHPTARTWIGRRDHALLALAIQTGLRVSELTALDIARRSTRHRRPRHLRRQRTQAEDHAADPRRPPRCCGVWLTERAGQPDDPLFPTIRGQRLSRDALERRLALHITHAATELPSLKEKSVTLHTLRHTAAMQLLHAGIDITVIALWLGHERVETTQIYLHADLALKETSDRPNDTARTPNPAATGRPTRSSPSSKRSDYADLNQPDPPTTTRARNPGRHNQEVGIVNDARLDGRFREDRFDRLGESLEPVDAADQDVPDAAGLADPGGLASRTSRPRSPGTTSRARHAHRPSVTPSAR